MATIKDVARRANVAISTVSNVLNNKNTVSREIVERVRQAMDELNYRPNLFASSLRAERICLIGVVVPRLEGVYAQIVTGMMEELDGKNAHIIVKKTDDFKNIQASVLEELAGLGVRGIALVNCDQAGTEQFDQLQRTGIPLIFIERGIEGYVCLEFENRRIVYDLTKKLLKKDRPDIVLATGPLEFNSEFDCAKGYEEAVREFGGESDRVSVPLNKQQSFYELLRFVEDRGRLPQYVIASSHMIGAAFREIAAILGQSVGIYELTGDDWQTLGDRADYMRIHRGALECGRRATQLLLKSIAEKSIPTICRKELPGPFSEQEHNPMQYPSKKLHILLVAGLTADALQRLTGDFSRRTNIEVKYEVCPNHQTLFERCMDMGRKKNSDYDVIMMDFLWRKDFAAAGFLQDLLPLWPDAKEFFSGFILSVQKELLDEGASHVFALPIAIGSQVLLYRRDLFSNMEIARDFYDKCGIQLQVPSTWGEFNLIARYFTREYNANSPTRYGTCLMGYNPHGLMEEFIPRLWANHGKIARQGKVTLQTPAARRALKNLCESYRYSFLQIQNYMENEQLEEFSRGDIALVNTYSIHIPSKYNVQMEKLVSSLGICMLPGRQMMLGEWELGINRYSKNIEAAAEFLRWAVCDRLAIHSTILGGFIPRKKVLENKELDSIYLWKPELEDYLHASRDMEEIAGEFHRRIWTSDVFSAMGEGIAQAMYNKKDIDAALRQMEEALCSFQKKRK